VPVKAEGQRKRLLYALQDVAKRPTGVPLKKEGEFVFPHPCKEANGAPTVARLLRSVAPLQPGGSFGLGSPFT
jgi:hypothetical protein